MWSSAVPGEIHTLSHSLLFEQQTNPSSWITQKEAGKHHLYMICTVCNETTSKNLRLLILQSATSE